MVPTPPDQPSIQQQFTDALDALVAQVKQDRSILAALLCGSLSHDTVWSKSDIDLLLVTVDDRKVEEGDLSLNADEVTVHAMLVPRTTFRKMVDGSVRNSFTHSFLTKGRLLYTHDPTIADLCATLTGLGQRDQQVQLLRAATHALPALYKAHKWFVTRADFDYTALWILYTATPLAQMEVIGAGLVADREVIPQAMRLHPALFQTIYADMLNAPKSRDSVQAALDAIDDYLAARETATGTPEDIAACRASHTGRFLKAHLRIPARDPRPGRVEQRASRAAARARR
ncbi:hypothetical protein BH24ACI5_BH24ACI5_20530 [soil metagenome]